MTPEAHTPTPTPTRARARARSLLALAVAAALAIAGCGDVGPPTPGDHNLTVVYQGTSDERPLEELRVHTSQEDYKGASNQLKAPLAPGESITVGPYGGSLYITVFRKKLSLPTSDIIALTIAEPIEMNKARTVWVFDESFRIFD